MKICAYGFFYEFYSIKFRSMIYEMVGWHHQCNGHKFGQTPGDGERQGALACFCPQGSEESDITWRLNNNIYVLLWALLHMVKCLGLSSSFFACVYSVFSVPFVEKTCLSPLNCLYIFVKSWLTIFVWVYIWLYLDSFFWFHWSRYLSFL